MYLAEAVAEEYWSREGINPEAVLVRKRIDFGYGHYGENTFDGMLEYEDDSFYVYINRDRGNTPNSKRARFTIAHEIGHFFIDEHRLAIMDGIGKHPSVAGMFDASDFNEEHEADLFAANLLMPPTRFRSRLSKSRSPLIQIKELSDNFNTSLTSTAIQFIALSEIPTCIIAWDAQKQYRYIVLSDELHKDDRRKYWQTSKYRESKCIPKDSATGKVLFGEEEQAEGVNTASYVFPSVQRGGYRDDLLREECIKLGKYGFLTIFSPVDNL